MIKRDFPLHLQAVARRISPVLLYAIHDIARFPRVQDCASY
jgi:hypothetical protein